jgi:hypothetical protein
MQALAARGRSGEGGGLNLLPAPDLKEFHGEPFRVTGHLMVLRNLCRTCACVRDMWSSRPLSLTCRWPRFLAKCALCGALCWGALGAFHGRTAVAMLGSKSSGTLGRLRASLSPPLPLTTLSPARCVPRRTARSTNQTGSGSRALLDAGRSSFGW